MFCLNTLFGSEHTDLNQVFGLNVVLGLYLVSRFNPLFGRNLLLDLSVWFALSIRFEATVWWS